ncbi:hypothetical protein FB639_005434, partial [Coemansia asiatica]
WHEQRVAEIRRREAERMTRYKAQKALNDTPRANFSIEEIDNDMADPKTLEKSSKDKTMDSKVNDSSRDDPDDEWLSDSEYDLEEASDVLALEALEMTERMRRRAAKRRTTAGGVSKESAASARGRRKGAMTYGSGASAAARASMTALMEAIGSVDPRSTQSGNAGLKGTRGGRVRRAAAQEHVRQLSDQSAIRRLVSEMGNGSADATLQILRSGVSVDLYDSLGRTPLHVASSTGNIEAIRLLIHMGADVNTTDRIGNTPLTLAATGARSDVILALLEGGADPRVGQGLVSAMTMVRSRLRLLRMEIQQARIVERAATGSLSDLVPRVRERRRKAAAVAKECVDVIHLLRHFIHKRIEEEQAEQDSQRGGNVLYEAYELSQTETASSSLTRQMPSSQAISELDSLSAQMMSLGFD